MSAIFKTMKEIIHGVCPSKSNCYKIGPRGLYKGSALKQYEKDFFIQCRNRGKKLEGYFEIYVDVFYPNQRADLDNSLKIILDCLQKCEVIVNDNKCVKIVANKFLDKEKPRIEIEIKTL